mmetsp:Transcript_34530/g.99417  ORF Transcript_34530/g.99417 Transcript_34530/m.99417 type:complete len:168 (+) Transcript_34530:123-626(+)
MLMALLRSSFRQLNSTIYSPTAVPAFVQYLYYNPSTMKTAFVLASLFVGVQSFGVTIQHGRVATKLYSNLPEDMMSEDQKEIKKIQEKWNSIRMMDRDAAQKELDGEWLEAYNRFYEKYDDDMERMTEYMQKLEKYIEPPKVQKKTKGQRKRDAYAKVLAREAARSS